MSGSTEGPDDTRHCQVPFGDGERTKETEEVKQLRLMCQTIVVSVSPTSRCGKKEDKTKKKCFVEELRTL